MDKKSTMKEALQYLSVDMLYGTIAGQLVRDYLTNNAEIIISGDWSPEETASRIKDAMISKETLEPLYTPAYDRVDLPIGAVLDVSEQDKKDYIESFIQSLPYSGMISTGPNTKINIADELRKKVSLMDDDYNVLFDFDGNKRTLKDEYRVLLSNEYKAPTRLDKLDVVMEGIRRLREKYPDYDAIAELTIDGKTFPEAIQYVVDEMDDRFMMTDALDDELATDRIYKTFKKYAEARYNSINSKPTSVEPIRLGVNKDNEIEVTSEYTFMSEDEIDSMSSPSMPDEERVRKNMLIILDGINSAKSIDSLEEYEERIASCWEEAKSLFPGNESFRRLYEKMISEYTNKQEELVMIKNNEDDAEIFLRNELREIKAKIEEIKTEFTHTYEDPMDQITEIRYELFRFREKAESMNAKIHHEIDDVEKLLVSVQMKAQYSMDNVNRVVRAKHQELDDLMSDAYYAFRRLDNTTDIREKAACKTKCEELARILSRKLEDYYREGYINEGDYENYLHDMNARLYYNDMEPIRRRY